MLYAHFNTYIHKNFVGNTVPFYGGALMRCFVPMIRTTTTTTHCFCNLCSMQFVYPVNVV